MKRFIIIGTDTNVGKTIISAGFANYFLQKKIKFDIQKWISTGDKWGISNDLLFILNSLNAGFKNELLSPQSTSRRGIHNNSINKADLKYNNLYSFKFASSPHLAAQLENKQINIQKILESLKNFPRDIQYLIIEGVGGLLVPITQKILLLDIIKQAKLPAILVISNTLGAINKTLLTVNSLNAYKIKILGLIFNDFIKENNLIRKDNVKTIKQFAKVKVLGEINKIKTKADLIKQFKKIGDNLIRSF